MVGKKYTKAEIIDSIYDKTGINRKDIRSVMDSFLDEIKAALIERKVIELRGFGTFEVKVRKGRREARNPRTGELFNVNSHGIAMFRAGRDLKQDVWNLKQESLLKQENPVKEVRSLKEDRPLSEADDGVEA